MISLLHCDTNVRSSQDRIRKEMELDTATVSLLCSNVRDPMSKGAPFSPGVDNAAPKAHDKQTDLLNKEGSEVVRSHGPDDG